MKLKFSVTQFGKPLDKSKYTWDEKTRTFSTKGSNLVLDFTNIGDCTFNTGSGCTFKTGSYCTFNTGSDCTFDTCSGCTFDTGSDCTFDTCSGCIFDTGSYCTFKTHWDCTFNTGSDCTFKTGLDCTFKTGSGSVAIRRDIFEIIKLPGNKTLTLPSWGIGGYVLDGFYYKDGKKQYKAIIADSILSKIISKKTLKNLTVYKVINHGEEDESYLVYDGENYSHGETLREAKEDLIYKLSNRDTSQYESYTLDTVLSLKEAIQMYRTITGACEGGTKLFVKGLKEVKDKYSVKEIIELTHGQWKHNLLCEFFKERSGV